MRARSLSSSRSAMFSCTSRRDPAQQTCPWLNQIASTTPSTTLSRSESSKTMKGDLPPSSSERRLPLPAVTCRMWRPTSVEPVKAILLMSGCLQDGLACLARVAGDDVDHARRQADLAANLGEGERGDRRVAGGLEHDGVAHRQRGGDLPGHHQQGEVPGDDLADHAERPMPGSSLSISCAQPA